MDSDDRRILLIVGGGEPLQKAAIQAALSGNGGSVILVDDIERTHAESVSPRNRGKGKNKRDRANKYESPFGKKRG